MNFFNYFFWLLPFLTFEFSAICGIILSIMLYFFRKKKANSPAIKSGNEKEALK